MKVGELKQLLANLDDNLEVTTWVDISDYAAEIEHVQVKHTVEGEQIVALTLGKHAKSFEIA